MKTNKKLIFRFLVSCLVIMLITPVVFTNVVDASEDRFTISTSDVTGNSSNLFTDVKETDWYYAAVMFVSQKGLMNGTSAASFSPNHVTTRSMIATTLWRMEGSPDVTGEISFSDIPSSKVWYSDAVIWAAQNGIFGGYGDGTFQPDTSISREQLTANLYRYAQYKGYKLTSQGNLDTFVDNNSVSTWAKEAMEWAVGLGLITGRNTNTLDPQGEATRAEIASILQRFHETSYTATGTEIDQTESKAGLEKKSIQTSELDNFNYLLYTPKNAEANMPLIIYLHGGSGKGSDLDLLTTNDGFPKYLQDGLIDSIPAYVVIPQLPSIKKGWSDVKASLKELMDNVSEMHSINRNKISLTGHSMGGTGVWDIAVSYPELFSSIAPLSGSIKMTETNINALSNIPVWAFVGSNDTIVDPNASVRFIESLKMKKSNAKITIFDGATHFDVPQLTYLDKKLNLIDWLLSNSK